MFSQVEFNCNFQMKAILSLALLVAVATTSASPTETRNSDHHREKRALPKIPIAIGLALAEKSGGSGSSKLPPHIDPNVGMSATELGTMPITASMSGPLAVLGGLSILASLAMAMNYFQAVNARRRSAHAYGGPYIQKRSAFNMDPESIVSFIDSFR